MDLCDFALHIKDDIAEISLNVEKHFEDNQCCKIWFRLPVRYVNTAQPPGSFSVPMSLLPAMIKEENVNIDWPICSSSTENISTIQDIYTSWSFAKTKIALNAPMISRRGRVSNSNVACFFTGGVDSWYTLLKHKNEITHLIYVHGFDVRLTDISHREKVSTLVHNVAATLGKQVVEIETNLRAFSDLVVGWPHYFGAALATIALLLEKDFYRIFIPSSYSYEYLPPCGIHPILDPLWSTKDVSILHDGCEASRLDKIRFISVEPLVKETLRVCWQKDVDYVLNCGVCEKCMRTMIGLEIANLSCSTFPHGLDYFVISQVKILPALRVFYEQLMVGAEHAGKSDLAQAIKKLLDIHDQESNKVRSDVLYKRAPLSYFSKIKALLRWLMSKVKTGIKYCKYVF